jgi:hypothetical protein
MARIRHAIEQAALVPRAFVAGALIIQGVAMLTTGNATYTAHGYDVVFGIMPRYAWGAAFALAGVALLARRHPISLAAVVAVSTVWAIGLTAAHWVHLPDGTAKSSTPVAGVAWLALALLTLWSAGRPGGVS